MKYIKGYKLYEGEITNDRIEFIILCIDTYSKEVEDIFELELEVPIYISQYQIGDSRLTKLIKVIYDEDDIDYFAEVFESFYTKNKKKYIGMRSLGFQTIALIYDYLSEKYPEIKEGEGMGFFNLKKHI